MSTPNQIATRFQHRLTVTAAESTPYPHWVLRDVLAETDRNAILSLPVEPPQVGDIQGRRETINSVRTFFSSDNCEQHDVCRHIAEAFQDRTTVQAIEGICQVDLDGSYLRIEYCQDTDGFWLEPHTDIGAKLYSMLLYLNDGPDDEEWGTDVFDDDRNFVKSIPFQSNVAMIFIPSRHTWHGFRKRPISGVRRSLIINYVIPEWRSRHELAFPDNPVQTRPSINYRKTA